MKIFRFLLFTLLTSGSISVKAQATDSTLKIKSPFDSLLVTHVQATGNKNTGSVAIAIDITNTYAKEAELVLSLGAFGDFGITDINGEKYKAYTSDYLGYSKTKGFRPISSILFGGKKAELIADITQTLKSRETKTMTFTIKNKGINALKEMHIACALSLNWVHVDMQEFEINNLKITWK